MHYSVLTYIFGDYELLHEVRNPDPEADYVLVTDNPDLHSDTWRVMCFNPTGHTLLEKVFDVRYHPFRFAGTELCIRLDGSISINGSLRPFIEKMEEGQYDRCLMVHPFRERIDDEYNQWVYRGRYPKEQAEKYMRVMASLGYDFGYRGLFQSGFEVIRNNSMNMELNDRAYDLLQRFSPDGHMDRIDQTVLSFVTNHYFADRLKVLPVSQKVINGNPMQLHHHGTNRPCRWGFRKKTMMFNKPVNTFGI